MIKIYPPIGICSITEVFLCFPPPNEIDYVIMIKNFLNPKGHQNPISASKAMAILLKGWILSIGGVVSGRVCACSLHSRLVSQNCKPFSEPIFPALCTMAKLGHTRHPF
jgi:hypothetical protein